MLDLFEMILHRSKLKFTVLEISWFFIRRGNKTLKINLLCLSIHSSLLRSVMFLLFFIAFVTIISQVDLFLRSRLELYLVLLNLSHILSLFVMHLLIKSSIIWELVLIICLFLLFLANRLLLNMSLRWSLFSHVVIHSQFSLWTRDILVSHILQNVKTLLFTVILVLFYFAGTFKQKSFDRLLPIFWGLLLWLNV
jgi:hypothetical protein